MSEEWDPVDESWQPPKDPEGYADWVAKFPEGIVEYGLKEGLTHAQLEGMRRMRNAFRADQFAAAKAALDALRERLRALCPEERWPAVFREGFARLPVTQDPERTQMIALLDKWMTGIERAHGGPVKPEVRCTYFEEGIRVQSTVPKPCEGAFIYYRERGRALWQWLGIYMNGCKFLYTGPKYADTPKRRRWPGKTLEFIAVGWFENEAFGFPCDPVAKLVPLDYPVALEEHGQ